MKTTALDEHDRRVTASRQRLNLTVCRGATKGGGGEGGGGGGRGGTPTPLSRS